MVADAERRRRALEELAYGDETTSEVRLRALEALRDLDRADARRGRWDFADEIDPLTDEQVEAKLDQLGWVPSMTPLDEWPEAAREHLDYLAQKQARERVSELERRFEERVEARAAELTRERFDVVEKPRAVRPEAKQATEPVKPPELITMTAAEMTEAVRVWGEENPQGSRRR